MLLFRATIEKQAVGNEINAARYTTTVSIHFAQCTFVNRRVAVPANFLQPVFDVVDGPVEVQRLQRRRCHHALQQRLHRRRMDQLQQLFLSHQKDLQQKFVIVLQIGQQAQFFQGVRRQALRLVHNQNRTLAVMKRAHQERLDFNQQVRLAAVLGLQTQRTRHHVQQVAGFELGTGQRCHLNPVAIQAGKNFGDQGGFPGPRCTGYGDKTFALVNAILEIILGIGITFVMQGKTVIGPQTEGFTGQSVIVFIHVEHSGGRNSGQRGGKVSQPLDHSSKDSLHRSLSRRWKAPETA